MSALVLVLNAGSSSLKVRVVRADDGVWLFDALVERIGGVGEATARTVVGDQASCTADHPDHESALDWVAGQLPDDLAFVAVGHRIVHGGEQFVATTRLDDGVIAAIDRFTPLAPLHNPPALGVARHALRLWPGLPQFGAFDTAFHATVADAVRIYALPRELARAHGIRRYGFHGLSHAYAAERAAVLTGRRDLRLVSLHLGAGCSGAAVVAGRSVDSTMGFTPAEGLVMATRTGDMDPTIPLWLQSNLGMTPAEVEHLITQESGLLGLCGHRDFRALLAAREAGSADAALAFDHFSGRICRAVGALAAAMNGIDALLFTGGIGENAPALRAAVCAGLTFLGIHLDPAANADLESGADGMIHLSGASIPVLVVGANEASVIAREVAAAIGAPGHCPAREEWVS